MTSRPRASDEHPRFVGYFDAHGATVLRYAWGLAESKADAHDIVQDTFLAAWRRRRELPADETLILPWLLATCRNTALATNRGNRRRAADELTDASPVDTLRARHAEREQAEAQLRWVRGEIEALPERERLLCLACLVDGRPFAEVAAELGISSAAARKSVQRTRERLRLRRAAAELDH